MILDSTNAEFWLGCFCSIALILMQQVKHSQAIKLFRENLAVYERCYGHDHAHVLCTKDLITDLQMQQAASMLVPASISVRSSAGRS